MRTFVSAPILYNHTRGGCGNYVILYHANVFSVQCGSCPDHTGSHDNLFQGCKTDLITHLKLCNVDSFFPYFSSIYDISINIHEYVNEIIFI